MDNIHIETTQNVTIEHNIASVGDRILAQLLDILFMTAYLFGIIFIIALIQPNSIALIIVIFLPIVFYSLFMEIFYDGQTLGMRIMKTKVVKLDGSQPTFVSYFLRWIFGIIDIHLFSGAVAIVTIIINGKGQRLGDIAAGTTVIHLKSRASLSDTIHVPLNEEYTPTFKEVKSLTDDDIHTLHEVLKNYYRNYRNPMSMKLLEDARNALENKMLINSELNSIQFLETVLKDYNYTYQTNTINTNV